MIDLLATGFANAVNFTRANRLVLVSELTASERFTQALQNMKILAEGGKLPPAPAGGGTTAGGAPPR